MNIDHLKVFLAVELLPECDIGRVENHEPLILLWDFEQGRPLRVREDGKVLYFQIQLAIGRISALLEVVLIAGTVVVHQHVILVHLLLDRLEIRYLQPCLHT